MRRVRQYFVTALLMCAVEPTFAAENGTTNYPAGVAGSFIGAMPPIPGIFFETQTAYTSANGLYDGNGRKVSVPFGLSGVVEVDRFIASYPGEFLGAHLYSMLVLPFAHLRQSIGGDRSSADGLGNPAIVPLLANWSISPHQNIVAAIDFIPNAGAYSTKSALNVGTNYGSISPIVAYRYSDPNGLEFSVAPRLLLNEPNGASANAITRTPQQYRSGDLFLAEFNAGYHFGKWQLGIVGGYTRQYTDDKVNGVKAFNIAGVPDGNRLISLNLGPSITYEWGPAIISANYQHTFYIRNGAKADVAWLNVAFPLFVPAAEGNGKH